MENEELIMGARNNPKQLENEKFFFIFINFNTINLVWILLKRFH